MTLNKLPSIFNQLRPVSVGFDNIFDHFERMFDDNDEFFRTPTSTFPFYNIVKTGTTTYNIEVALDEIRPFLKNDGGDISLVSFDNNTGPVRWVLFQFHIGDQAVGFQIKVLMMGNCNIGFAPKL